VIQSIPLWLFICVLALGISTIVLIIFSIQIHRRLQKFMVGKDAKSLESNLAWLTKKNAEIEDSLVFHKEALENLDSRIKKSVRGYSLLRYDAYEEGGGNQSFASGIIDENEDGFILSVITNRNHVGIYAKPIISGNSISNLTKEEALALEASKKNLKK
jgi:Protein of unknown function (DUF4446)